MPRPCKIRRVATAPVATFYKPQGIPMGALHGVVLPVEGLEALRLADAEGLDHDEAARRMEVSRPTFSRLLAKARHVVASALVNGWALRIDGGDFRLESDAEEGGPGCRRRRVCPWGKDGGPDLVMKEDE